MTPVRRLRYMFVLFLCSAVVYRAQNAVLQFDNESHDYGVMENVNNLRSEFIVKNNSTQPVYFLRADAAKGIKVKINRKNVPPGDTSLITVLYEPTQSGTFSEKIKLISSIAAQPHVLEIKGNIKNILFDNTTACYNFSQGKRHQNQGIVALPTKTKQENKAATEEKPQPVVVTDTVKPITETRTTVLDIHQFKPNNIVFLIDVSGSMGDSLKLPLMKLAMHRLIQSLRDTDRVSMITYADSLTLLCEAVSGSEHAKLDGIINGLHAKGYTRGAKAILYSLDYALRHYIDSGNNQIFMASDGKFPFYDSHYHQWTAMQGSKIVRLSTLALGDDRKALRNLKEIAGKGNGSFIRIKNMHQAKEAILDEVKLRSMR